ncbi:MFS transporter [Pseudomonas sp. D47]|uniref:MFS transporter n=1 Tax=Pseudomonas sp. D47 TaxID=3159447 RepID=UPI00387B87C0
MHPPSPALTKGLTLILAICCGFSVATIYYNQAMLPLIANTFEVSTAHVGQIAMLTQLGYASGLLLFVPLGDRISRRTLILAVLCLNFISLLASAAAPTYAWLLVASVLLGLSGISAQVIIPAASDLSTVEQKGAVLGLMVSGLSAGGLLARTVSGAGCAAVHGDSDAYAGVDFNQQARVWRLAQIPVAWPGNTRPCANQHSKAPWCLAP